MGDETRKVLNKIEPDRRRFVQRILAIAGFALPSVRSFLLAGPGTTMPAQSTQTAQAQTTVAPTTSSTTTTAAPTSTTTTSTQAPTTTPSPTDPFFLQWFFNADGR